MGSSVIELAIGQDRPDYTRLPFIFFSEVLPCLSLSCKPATLPGPETVAVTCGCLTCGVKGLLALSFAAMVTRYIGFDSTSREGDGISGMAQSLPWHSQCSEAEGTATLNCLLLFLLKPSWDTGIMHSTHTWVSVLCPAPPQVCEIPLCKPQKSPCSWSSHQFLGNFQRKRNPSPEM